MDRPLISVCILLLVIGLPAGLPAADVDEIRKLIPAASAMKKKDFERMATMATAPRASDFADQSLTLTLLALRPKDSELAKREFQFLADGLLRPADLAGEQRESGAGFDIVCAAYMLGYAHRIEQG